MAVVPENEVYQTISTLAGDEMEGRGVLTAGIGKAADYIAEQFKDAGLATLSNADSNYRQTFTVLHIRPLTCEVMLDGQKVDSKRTFVISDQPGLNWNTDPDVRLETIPAGGNFRQSYQGLLKKKQDALVFVDESFAQEFARYKQHFDGGQMVNKEAGENQHKPNLVFVLTPQKSNSFRVSYTGEVKKIPLFNVVGVLPGKSKPKEYVIFSSHYDHLGIIDAVGKDSIANGADDDASGTTAVITLAKWFAKQKNNERTLIFATFTAEESGGFGSKYFSQQLNPNDVVAMVNIEMIGKDSKFGPNTMYITGFERSDFGKILQKNVANTGFAFHPDPYPEQNLFYRSDNATLAALGVPAHTVSTVQIDKDQYYHTVKDELQTLDIKNITSSIQAIALGVRSIVAGEDTPSRIPPLTR